LDPRPRPRPPLRRTAAGGHGLDQHLADARPAHAVRRQRPVRPGPRGRQRGDALLHRGAQRRSAAAMRKVHSAAIAALVVMLAGALDLTAKDAADAGPLTTENFFDRLNKHPSAFGAFLFFTSREVQDNPELRGYAAQMLATNYSFLGRPNDAIREFPIYNLEPAPADLPDRATHRAVSAVEWIAARSRQYQVVMVNEAHHKPQTRLLTLALLPELRTLGFKYLAAETFA